MSSKLMFGLTIDTATRFSKGVPRSLLSRKIRTVTFHAPENRRPHT